MDIDILEEIIFANMKHLQLNESLKSKGGILSKGLLRVSSFGNESNRGVILAD